MRSIDERYECRTVGRWVPLFAMIGTSLLTAGAAASDELQKAPPFALSTAAGETVEFPAASEGHPAILLFWATWCPYSGALMPHLQKIADRYAEQGVEVYAVNIREDDDPVAFLRRKKLDFVLLLEGDDVATEYGVKGTPGLMVIDGRGYISYSRAPTELRPKKVAKIWAEEVQEALEAALQGEPFSSP